MPKLISHILQDQLLQTVAVVGIDNTIKVLKKAQNHNTSKSKEVDFVIESVAEIVGIEKERILNGNSRTDERKIALAVCIYFLKNKMSYSFDELNIIFNKDESVLSRYNSMIDKMSDKPSNDFDRKLSECFSRMSIKFSEKIIKNDSRARRTKGV
jgi:chromosomal replication initiation ATPase DnaA